MPRCAVIKPRHALPLQMEVHYFLRSCESGDLLRLIVQLPAGHAMPVVALASEPPRHCMPTGFVFAREIQPEIMLHIDGQTVVPHETKAHLATKLCMLDAKVYENELGRKKIEEQMIRRQLRRSRSASSLPLTPAVERLATFTCTPSMLGLARFGTDLTLTQPPMPNDYVEDGWRSVELSRHLSTSRPSQLSPRRSSKLKGLVRRYQQGKQG